MSSLAEEIASLKVEIAIYLADLVKATDVAEKRELRALITSSRNVI